MHEEDAMAQLDLLRNVKQYLIDKNKKSEDKIYTLENDITALKKLLRIEKQVNQKEQTRIGELERELRDERTRHDEKETEIREKVNELEVKLREKERLLEMVTKKYTEVKTHKKLLKEEVLSLMDQLKSTEFKLQGFQTTVNSISEFFRNNTLQKLEKLKERKVKEKKEVDPNESQIM